MVSGLDHCLTSIGEVSVSLHLMQCVCVCVGGGGGGGGGGFFLGLCVRSIQGKEENN